MLQFNTDDFHKKFSTLTTKGACGVNLLPDYWKSRSNAEIPSMALNGFALLVSLFLSWRLMKVGNLNSSTCTFSMTLRSQTFGWQTFKRVGASRTIKRVYQLVLVLSVTIQLSLFFVVASVALWLDQIYNGDIGRLTTRSAAFRGIDMYVFYYVCSSSKLTLL